VDETLFAFDASEPSDVGRDTHTTKRTKNVARNIKAIFFLFFLIAKITKVSNETTNPAILNKPKIAIILIPPFIRIAHKK